MKKKKNILVTDYSTSIFNAKNYIFLSKYLFSFYNRKKIKYFKMYDQDYIFNSKKNVEKNFFFTYQKIETYRSQLIKQLNFYHNIRNDKKYWGLILDTWLFFLISSIKIRYDIISNFKIIFKNFSLDKSKLSRIYFDSNSLISDYHESLNINNYIYYRIINLFKKIKVKNKITKKKKNINFYKSFKSYLIYLLLRLVNLFILIYVKIYRPIIIISGYNGFKNSSLIFIKSFGKILSIIPKCLFLKINSNNIDYLYRNKIAIKVRDKFDEIFNLIVKELLPMSFLENFNAIRKINNFNFLASNITAICSAQYYYIDHLRILLAEIKKKNKEFIIFQHGGNVDLKKQCHHQDFDKKYGDKIYYWNNSNGLGDNYLSRFKKIRNFSKERTEKNILFFQSPNRMTPKLCFCALDKSNHPFLSEGYVLYKNLHLSLKENFKVKLFPNQIMNSLSIKNWKKNSNNKIEFVEEWKELYRAKLLILDNISTAFYEAIRLNIPVLILNDIKKFRLKRKYEKLFIDLKKTGIIHDTPVSAANFINQKYNMINVWWKDVTGTKEFSDFVKFIMPTNNNYVFCIVKELLKK